MFKKVDHFIENDRNATRVPLIREQDMREIKEAYEIGGAFEYIPNANNKTKLKNVRIRLREHLELFYVQLLSEHISEQKAKEFVANNRRRLYRTSLVDGHLYIKMVRLKWEESSNDWVIVSESENET